MTGILGMLGILLLLVVSLTACTRNASSVPHESNDFHESGMDSVAALDSMDSSVPSPMDTALSTCPKSEKYVHVYETRVNTEGDELNMKDTVALETNEVDSVVVETETIIVDSVLQTTNTIQQFSAPDTCHLSPEVAEHSSEEIELTNQSSNCQFFMPFMALRTNLLYDAVLIPNIGVEVALGNHFTLGADWFATWLSNDANHWYWQGYGGYLTARYYFGKASNELRFTGHHVGIYGTALTYDVEWGGKGYQAAKFGFGGGVEYGYSLRVARSLSLDFNLGLGYQGGEYKTYLPTDDGTGHYVWESTRMRHWWGPTKAEISLKWLIGPTEKKEKSEKGGAQ